MDRYTIPIELVAAFTNEFSDDEGMLLKDSTVKSIVERCVNDELEKRAKSRSADNNTPGKMAEATRGQLAEDLLNHDKIVEIRFEKLQEHLDKKIAAIHRNIRSGDKVSKVLIAVVDKAAEVLGPETWVCPECGEKVQCQANEYDGVPHCSECGCDRECPNPHPRLFETEEWKVAEEHVLRIKRVKATKEAKKRSKLKFKKKESTEKEFEHTDVCLDDELLGYRLSNEGKKRLLAELEKRIKHGQQPPTKVGGLS